MTAKELTDRYLSDVANTKLLFENEKIDRFELDEMIENLDHKLFENLGFCEDTEVNDLVERIMAYS